MPKPTPLFSPAPEREITASIVRAFAEEFVGHASTDAIVVGGGPSGLVCAWDLARRGRRVLVVEQTNYLGGGFWLGGYLFNKLTVRRPAERVLDELDVPYSEPSGVPSPAGFVVADAPHACSALIRAACLSGVKFAQMTEAVDLVLRGGRVDGVVVNWSPVAALPKALAHVDPIALESSVVVDATGHDAHLVQRLAGQGLHERVPGDAPMWVEESEDRVVEGTREVFPGLVVTGLAVAAVDGSPRMGPTFGAMLLSGRRAAEVCEPILAAREQSTEAAPFGGRR